MTSIHDSTGANRSFSDKSNIPPCYNDTSPSSTDINHNAISHSHDGIIQNQHQSLSVPLAQQPFDRTQTTDDTSSTLVGISDTDTNDIQIQMI